MTKRDHVPGTARLVDHSAPAWLEPMPVRNWMQPSPTVVRADTAVTTAAELMRTRKIRHLPVVDGEEHLVGILTDRDLRQVVFDPMIRERLGEAVHALDDLAVREVMTWGVVSVRPSSDLREAAFLMHERKIGALPVVDGRRVIGILTDMDVLAALNEILRHRLSEVRPLAASSGSGEPYDYGFAPGGPGE